MKDTQEYSFASRPAVAEALAAERDWLPRRRSSTYAEQVFFWGDYGELGTNSIGGNYSSILGGRANTVTGAYSAILGGSGNNDNGLAYVGIFGSNISNPANMSANTFHVNCLNAIDTPNAIFGPFVSGSVYWKAPGALLPTDRVLVIAP